MNIPLSVNYTNRRPLISDQVRRLSVSKYDEHRKRVMQELQDLGMTRYGLFMRASRYLPNIIHTAEHVGGVVYGKYNGGLAMLVATDRRVIFLEKRPLFVNEDDITYDVVSGVSHGHVGLGSTITLHTRIQDYTIKTLNEDSVQTFIAYIEDRCLEHESTRGWGNVSTKGDGHDHTS